MLINLIKQEIYYLLQITLFCRVKPADFSVADSLPHFPSLRAMNALRTVFCLPKVLKMREIDRFLSFLPSFLSYPSVIPLLSLSYLSLFGPIWKG